MAAVLVLWAVLQEANPQEAKYECRKALAGVAGVLDVSVGGIDGRHVLIVRVEDAGAREVVRQKLGNAYRGIELYLQVSASVKAGKADPAPVQATTPPPAKKKEELEIPDDRHTNVWKASVQDCDIVRQHLGLKPVTSRRKDGRTVSCRLMLRQVVGDGGGHSYVYTKHRIECPIRLGRVRQPDWSDNFVAWVFQSGITPAMRGGFLFPYELRASDKLWEKQASEDLMTRIGYLREGAEWTETPTKRPGLGWRWEQPQSEYYVPSKTKTK